MQGRAADIERAYADPPQVHAGAVGPTGELWSTGRACYDFLAERCVPGTRSLETGLGMSTLLFAQWCESHVCVTGTQDEVDRLRAYCGERDVGLDPVRFCVGSSHEVLPALDPGELDLVFIDGAHGYPMPVIDWFYACRHLRVGGTVVIDDVQLPHVSRWLVRFLDADPRWERLGGTKKFAAFERHHPGSLSEEWTDQPFMSPSRARHHLRRVRERAASVREEGPLPPLRRFYASLRRRGGSGPR